MSPTVRNTVPGTVVTQCMYEEVNECRVPPGLNLGTKECDSPLLQGLRPLMG